jgi:NhaP-type Na+/H+ or K+/H+ antiporter
MLFEINMNEYRKLAHDAQEKFDHYFPVLAFSILGLAVQTAKFGHSADRLEVASWALLLVAGLLALWRLKKTPVLHLLDGRYDLGMQRYVIQDTKDDMQEHELEMMKRELAVRHKRVWRLFDLQLTIFAIGVVALLAARAIVGLYPGP